ncbi:restriction endonuclease [Rhizobium leguminosarum]|uniref:restriction endonuclease n=1 Tax=Rhizobium leguminosarum TaxID=384 RepID=UPI0013F16EDA|nr:restriction endonuclease [Rhizobium leguminosarum]
MPAPIAFYSRCKPQNADAIEIALATKRIYIGYPMAKTGAPYDPRNLQSCVIDPSCRDSEWFSWHRVSSKNRQFNQNRNLVAKVTLGSIAMIPRPSLGVIYLGKVAEGFRLEDNPPWFDEYLALRKRQGLTEADGEDTWHAADVAQCWVVDDFRPIPVPRIPAWIRRSMFGRSTYGVISRQDGIDDNPYAVLDKIMESPGFLPRIWTTDVREVERRLLTDLTPSTFEHLAVSLLQLENPHEVWTQVGGSGDGGIDGVGANDDGSVSGLLQCKWHYWGGRVFAKDTPWGAVADARRYLAALAYQSDVIPPEDCIFLDRPTIASLVVKHWKKLPLALSLRAGAADDHDHVSTNSHQSAVLNDL